MFNPKVSTRSAEGSLILLQLEGVGLKTATCLVQSFPSLGAVKEAADGRRLERILRRVPSSLADDKHWDSASDKAQQILEKAATLGVTLLVSSDESYPELLSDIPDRPLVLYTKGHLRPDKRNVACIGTREPSPFGVQATQRIVKTLVETNWSIVSGLAKGIDTEAHRQALASDGHTVAVLANGLDTVYPRANAKLAAEILEKGGALVSEQPFDVSALSSNLIQRDRIQSGMSIGTIVMQTGIEGGSMHTVRFTLMQGRRLFVPVPTGDDAQHPKAMALLL